MPGTSQNRTRAAKRPGGANRPNEGGRPAPAKAKGSALGGWTKTVLLFVVLLTPVLCVVGGLLGEDSSTVVPPPTATERADTVPILKRAADAQGVCYGWRLRDATSVVSVGSNLGDGIAVEGDPRCPRWVEVRATVYYTSASSESEDWSTVQVTASDGIEPYAIADGLARFDLDQDVFIDDPGWAICRAAAVLPLLTAEVGAAAPAPTGAADAPASVPPLPDAGSDFWRDRWLYLLGGAGLLLVGALLVAAGWAGRRRVRNPS